MKKSFLSFCLMASSMWLSAQLVEVASIEPLPISVGNYQFPTMSPAGDYLLACGTGYAGLVRIDLKTYQTELLSSAPNAGRSPQISADGKRVVYREDTYLSNRRYTAVKMRDLTTRSVRQLQAPTRALTALQMTGGSVNMVVASKLAKSEMASSLQSTSAPVISVENSLMVLYRNGQRTVLAPNGKDKSYFWCSVSPDGKKIVYTVAAMGTWVCDIQGKNPISLGILGAPKWLSDHLIIGMHDKDDGHQVISSTIDVVSVDSGERQILTVPSLKGMYPSASADGKKVAFNTPAGELFIINLK